MKGALFGIFIVLLSLEVFCYHVKNVNLFSEEFTDDYSERIDSILDTKPPRIFNGLVIVTENEKTKYIREEGFSFMKEKLPVSYNSKYRIMSNSMEITAVLVLREAERGNIDLHKTINTYLPDLKQGWTNKVSVHHLLNMSSGLINLEQPLIFDSGNGYSHNNLNYTLLGRIVEQVTGREYAEIVNELFDELGMSRAYCYQLEGPNEGIINGYWNGEDSTDLVDINSLGFTVQDWQDFIPAGGIVSTVADVGIWDEKLHGGEILGDEYYQLLITPSNRGAHPVFDNDTIGYAYGVRVDNRYSILCLGDGGHGLGFISCKFYIPEKKVGVIIWENICPKESNPLTNDATYYFENEIRRIIMTSNLVN